MQVIIGLPHTMRALGQPPSALLSKARSMFVDRVQRADFTSLGSSMHLSGPKRYLCSVGEGLGLTRGELTGLSLRTGMQHPHIDDRLRYAQRSHLVSELEVATSLHALAHGPDELARLGTPELMHDVITAWRGQCAEPGLRWHVNPLQQWPVEHAILSAGILWSMLGLEFTEPMIPQLFQVVYSTCHYNDQGIERAQRMPPHAVHAFDASLASIVRMFHHGTINDRNFAYGVLSHEESFANALQFVAPLALLGADTHSIERMVEPYLESIPVQAENPGRYEVAAYDAILPQGFDYVPAVLFAGLFKDIDTLALAERELLAETEQNRVMQRALLPSRQVEEAFVRGEYPFDTRNAVLTRDVLSRIYAVSMSPHYDRAGKRHNAIDVEFPDRRRTYVPPIEGELSGADFSRWIAYMLDLPNLWPLRGYIDDMIDADPTTTYVRALSTYYHVELMTDEGVTTLWHDGDMHTIKTPLDHIGDLSAEIARLTGQEDVFAESTGTIR